MHGSRQLWQAGNRLIKYFGAPVFIVRREFPEYDPTDLNPQPVESKVEVLGAKMDYNQREIDGTRIRYGDQRIYLQVKKGFEPRTGDEVEIQGEIWSVILSRKIMPGNITYLYDVQIRK